MTKRIMIAVLPLAFLVGCATAGQESASTADQARCQAMAEKMGTASTHDHAEMKGTGSGGMNVTHERCRQVLAEAK